MTIDVTVTSEPMMKYNKNNEPYVIFNAVENTTKNEYFIIVYNKHTLSMAYLYLHRGDNISLVGKLKSSDKLKQCFITKFIGEDFLQKIYS